MAYSETKKKSKKEKAEKAKPPECVIIPESFPAVTCVDKSIRDRAETVDLVFNDPPYNIGVEYGAGHNDSLSFKEYKQFTLDWINLSYALLRPGGSLWCAIPDGIAGFIANHLTNHSDRWTRINWVVWHYRFGMYGPGRFINSKVHLLYFVKNPEKKRVWRPKAVSEESLRKTLYADPRIHDSEKKGTRPFLDTWYGEHLSRVQGNNAERRTKKRGAKEDHPNQVPEMLMARIIRCCTRKGDTVCDMFTGSGTTPTVAVALGRNFIGWENNVGFAKSAEDRVKRGPVRNVSGPLASPVGLFTTFDKTLAGVGKTRMELMKEALGLLVSSGNDKLGKCEFCDPEVGYVCELCMAGQLLEQAVNCVEEA